MSLSCQIDRPTAIAKRNLRLWLSNMHRIFCTCEEINIKLNFRRAAENTEQRKHRRRKDTKFKKGLKYMHHR